MSKRLRYFNTRNIPSRDPGGLARRCHPSNTFNFQQHWHSCITSVLIPALATSTHPEGACEATSMLALTRKRSSQSDMECGQVFKENNWVKTMTYIRTYIHIYIHSECYSCVFCMFELARTPLAPKQMRQGLWRLDRWRSSNCDCWQLNCTTSHILSTIEAKPGIIL